MTIQRSSKFQIGYLLRYEPSGIICENRMKRSELTTLESRRYNPSAQNYKWERSTAVGEVLYISSKQLNSGTQVYIIGLFKKPKGKLGQKLVSARCVDFWNGLDDSTVSMDIIAAFSDVSEVSL